jgi:hypothetical protein
MRPTTRLMEVLIMKTYLGYVMPITLAALAACSENKLEVGNVEKDAGVPGADAPIQCEYQGRMVGVDEVLRADDGCNTCKCFPSTRQVSCTMMLCLQDGGATNPGDDGPIQCEYQGRMVGAGETVPAKDNCNTCTCTPSSRQMICTRNACNMDGGSASTTDANGGSGGGGAGGNIGIGGSGGSAGGATACPFVAWPKPISLGTLLGAGKSPSTGTIYVVDEVESLQRVFISDTTGALVRQRVSGSGSSPDFMVFTTNGPDAIVTVQIDTPTGQPKRMGVYQGVLKDRKTIVIGQDGEELTMLTASEFSKAMLRNLPGTVTTEYVASTDDGNFMLVTRPTDDWTFNDFRVFYGPATAMEEKLVTIAMRGLDGGSTKMTFILLGGEVATADGGFVPGPATLSIGSRTLPLTLLSVPPANASYTCFTH